MLIKQTASSMEKVDDGMHPAICVSIVGVGTQRTPFTNDDGTPKVQDKVVVTWQLESGNLISKEYTASLHEKANLRKDLESWRGRKFKDSDLEDGFDVKDQLGELATLQVMRNKNDYPEVALVLPKTKEFKTDKPLVYYYVGEHDGAVFDSLPEWIQKKIKLSFEWDKLNLTDGSGAPDEPDEIVPDDGTMTDEDFMKSIPF